VKTILLAGPIAAIIMATSFAAAKPVRPTISVETLKSVTKTLSSDAFEGRAPTTAGEDLTLYYQVGRELADGKAWPNWYPDAEFRAIRDKSRAAK
jgi:hypothetical protein